MRIFFYFFFTAIVFLLIWSCSMRPSGDPKATSMHVIKMGEGKPYIIFEAGLGSTGDSWTELQTEIAKNANTLAYDRVGYGKSPIVEEPRTVENQVKTLHQVVEKHIPTSEQFILVSHSLGGFIIRKYQETYPNRVSGMVLIDPSHEELYEKIFATMSSAALKSYKLTEKMATNLGGKGAKAERDEYDNTAEKMKKVPFPKNIPVTIIASWKTDNIFLTEERMPIKKELYNNWVDGKSNIKLVGTDKAGHFVHDGEPQLVIDLINEMIKKVE